MLAARFPDSGDVGDWRSLADLRGIQVGATFRANKEFATLHDQAESILYKKSMPILDYYRRYLVGAMNVPDKWGAVSVGANAISGGTRVWVLCQLFVSGRRREIVWRRAVTQKSKSQALSQVLDQFVADYKRGHPKGTGRVDPLLTEAQMLKIDAGLGIGPFRLGDDYDLVSRRLGMVAVGSAIQGHSVFTWPVASGGQVDVWSTPNAVGKNIVRYVTVTSPAYRIANGIGPQYNWTKALARFHGAKALKLPGVHRWQFPGGVVLEESEGRCFRVAVYRPNGGPEYNVQNLVR
jgi:hypothetical protein